MTTSDRRSHGALEGVTGRATLADVARLAEVSTKTVSRALSGAPNVDPLTRARVQRAAATLRFRPNALARELRSGGITTTVGFVIGDLTNPFYGQVAGGVERALARRGLTLVLAATEDDAAAEARVVVAMLERRIRALLLVPIADDHGYLEGERQFGTPIVAVDRPLANATSDSVVFDNRRGAHDGVAALLAAGHRRIAFVGSTESLFTHRERLAGFRQALADAGLPEDPALVRTDGPDIASAERATLDLLAQADPPTAVFAGNNRAAIGVLQARRTAGTEIGLLAFDDFELAESLGISVVAHDPAHMGVVAAELALRRMADPMGVVEQLVLPTRVVLRGSELAGRPA
jgi:LacI family transcriptional regulator